MPVLLANSLKSHKESYHFRAGDKGNLVVVNEALAQQQEIVLGEKKAF